MCTLLSLACSCTPANLVSVNLVAPALEMDPTASDEGQTPINPETGEINWDCPCLKGALDPPCGDAFKAAFTCFVASKTDPKGEDCVAVFQILQDCFRAHPEKYRPEEKEDDVQ